MRILALILVFMALIVVVAAEKDSYVTEPYRVAFDMGFPKETYSVNITGPIKSESLDGDHIIKYGIVLINKTGFARLLTIDLMISESEQKSIDVSEIEKEMRYVIHEQDGISNIESTTREIDGVEGAIASADFRSYGIDEKRYWVYFNPKCDSRRLSVMIISNFPWDEGTLALLKTIHVEKLNATG